MLTEEIKTMVEEECKKDSNPFTYQAFEHFQHVVKYGKQLAKKLKANEEIVEIAAWLHDWGSIIGNYKNHHIIGAEYAEELLKKLNYPQDRIEQIKHCIYAHRGSENIQRKSLEAEIVASADAMAHLKEVSGLFYLAYSTNKLNYHEGVEFVKEKVEQGWKKIMPEGKEIIEDKYKAIIKILEDAT